MSGARTQPGPPTEAVAEAPRGPDLARFHTLLAAAQTATPEELAVLAGALNALLVEMRLPGHDAAEAGAILNALDLSALTRLTDERGRNCRTEAVETLLAMGFPHALAVPPQDLEFARANPTVTPHHLREPDDGAWSAPWKQKTRWTRRAAALVVVAGQAAQLVAAVASRPEARPLEAEASVTALATLAIAVWLALARVDPEAQVAPLALLSLGGLASLGLALVTGSPGAAAGALAVMVALAIALGWQQAPAGPYGHEDRGPFDRGDDDLPPR